MKYGIAKILSCAIIFTVMIFCGKGPDIGECKRCNDSTIIETSYIYGEFQDTTFPTIETSNTNAQIADISLMTYQSISEPIVEEEEILTKEEIDLIALVTMAEAEGECEYGKRLVIDTILNRVDDKHFPGTVYDVIYQPNQFSAMWNGRVDRCYVMDDVVELVKQELKNRSNTDVIFFMAGGYSKYGKPLFQVDHHYFSSYN